jgi:SLOG in TRPM, prokaryote
VLAARAASLTILVNGGEIAWEDVTQSVKAGHPVLVIGGSGRTADTIANALHKEATDERTKRLVDSNLLRVVDLTSDFGELTRVVEEMLSV